MNAEHIQYLLNQRHRIRHPGLFQGKTGVAIVLYQLARKYKNHFYEDHADFLMEEITEALRENVLQPDFDNGLAGIGWGSDTRVCLITGVT